MTKLKIMIAKAINTALELVGGKDGLTHQSSIHASRTSPSKNNLSTITNKWDQWACLLLLLTCFSQGNAQISMYGSDTTSDPSAILEVSSIDRGVLLPRMSTLNQDNITAPANGLLIYNTTNQGFRFYNGTNWQGLTENIFNKNGKVLSDRTLTLDSSILQFTAFGRRNALEIKRQDTEDIGLSFRNSGGFLAAGIAASSIASNNADGLDFFTIGKSHDPNNIGISMQLKNSGSVVFPDYGMGNHSGSASQLLAVGLNGMMVEKPISHFDNEAVRIIQDADNDTKIYVEKFMDEDIIRFNLNGKQQFIMEENLVGDGRLDINSSGSNLLIGHQAGQHIDSNGVANVFIGNSAGLQTISGQYNVYIGNETGQFQEGSNNVMIGRRSGVNSASGSGNVYLGSHAGSGASGSNKLYIQNSSSNSPLIYGEFDNRLLRINGELRIRDEYSFPEIDGDTGDLLVTDGNGYLTWMDTISLSEITADNMVTNALTIAANSALGRVLTSDANGNATWQDYIIPDTLVANALTIVADTALGKVLTSDANGNATWKDNNSRVAHVQNQNQQTFQGSLTGWTSSQYVTNSMAIDAGDVVVVQATFAAQLEGGSGTDILRFRLGMGNGITATFGGETALLQNFENARDKYAQVSIQHTFIATTPDNYVFRIFVDMGNTDDDVKVDNVNISAVKY